MNHKSQTRYSLFFFENLFLWKVNINNIWYICYRRLFGEHFMHKELKRVLINSWWLKIISFLKYTITIFHSRNEFFYIYFFPLWRNLIPIGEFKGFYHIAISITWLSVKVYFLRRRMAASLNILLALIQIVAFLLYNLMKFRVEAII